MDERVGGLPGGGRRVPRTRRWACAGPHAPRRSRETEWRGHRGPEARCQRLRYSAGHRRTARSVLGPRGRPHRPRPEGLGDDRGAQATCRVEGVAMSPQEKLDLAQRSYAAFSAGPDVEAILPLYDHACEWRMGYIEAAFGSLHGHEGLREFADQLANGFAHFRCEIAEARI